MKWILILTLIINCSVDIYQIPVVRKSTNPIFKIDKSLYIGKFDIYLADRKYYTDAWKASFQSVLKSQRIFKNVLNLPVKKEELEEKYYILDLDIYPSFKDNYNWWVTWPAIYPMLGYWPFQLREGVYKVEIVFSIYDENQKLILKDSILVKDEAEILFYGFYKSTEIEDMIEEVNLKGMEKCAQKIKDIII
ncbi:MAG: hypothetical protein KDK36_20880 [Leptospiraceae bacterium]|nr:hypothetical protein [Leptospiraceae bacterium]